MDNATTNKTKHPIPSSMPNLVRQKIDEMIWGTDYVNHEIFSLRFKGNITFQILDSKEAMPVYGKILIFQKSTGLYLPDAIIKMALGHPIFYLDTEQFENDVALPNEDIEIHYEQ